MIYLRRREFRSIPMWGEGEKGRFGHSRVIVKQGVPLKAGGNFRLYSRDSILRKNSPAESYSGRQGPSRPLGDNG